MIKNFTPQKESKKDAYTWDVDCNRYSYWIQISQDLTFCQQKLYGGYYLYRDSAVIFLLLMLFLILTVWFERTTNAQHL